MRTEVCDRLGMEFPIFAFSHCRDVVAAVTNAGGFGVLGATGHSPRTHEIDLAWIDEQVKGKPYGVDLLLPAKYDAATAAQLGKSRPWKTGARSETSARSSGALPGRVPGLPGRTSPARYGVPELPDHITGHLRLDQRLPASRAEPARRGLQATRSARWPAQTSARRRRPSWSPAPTTRDVVVAALVGTAEHARRQQAAGVDLIVAQGTEAGGHTGTISTMVLVPEVIRAVHPTPVLAAGGIVTGAQVAAAMALGAQGVWCGSVWLTTAEAETDPVVKQKMLLASASDTVRSRSLTGKPARMLRSAWTEEWEEASQAPAALPMPLQTMLTAPAPAAHQAATRPHAGQRRRAASHLLRRPGRRVAWTGSARPARSSSRWSPTTWPSPSASPPSSRDQPAGAAPAGRVRPPGPLGCHRQSAQTTSSSAVRRSPGDDARPIQKRQRLRGGQAAAGGEHGVAACGPGRAKVAWPRPRPAGRPRPCAGPRSAGQAE